MRWTTLSVGIALLGAVALGVAVLREPLNVPTSADPGGPEPPRVEAVAADAGATVLEATRSSDDGAATSRDGAASDAVAALRDAVAALDASSSRDLAALDALFAAAAEADAESALAILAELKARHSTFELGWAARALLDAIHDDAHLLERWIGIVLRPNPPSGADERFDPALERIADARFAASGITALALLDPDAALAYWQRLGAESYTAVPEEGIRAWLADDPHSLLRRASELGIGERDRLLREWAKVDPAAAVAYAVALEDFGAGQSRPVALSDLAMSGLRGGETSVDQVFAAAALLPKDVADWVRGQAIDELAKSDPDAAAGRLGELGAIGRNAAVGAIARRFAEREPFSALAWARQQGLMSGEIAVVETAVKANPQRAFDLALRTSEPVRDEALRRVIAESLHRDATSAPELASRLEILAPGSKRYETAMTNLVSHWLDEKPDAAFDWVVANAARLPDEAHAAAARRAPADTFDRIVQRLPPDARAIWLAESR